MEEVSVKGLSVLAFVLGISFLANAVARQWAFDFSKTSGQYVLFDVLLGVGCSAISIALWRAHAARSLHASRSPLV